MTEHPVASRAYVRTLAGSLTLGSLVGLAIGGAYWAGGAARTQVAHSRIERLAGAAAAGGFSDRALHTVAARQDPGALAVAQRHDEVVMARLDLRTRRMDALDERLRQVKASNQDADKSDDPVAPSAAVLSKAITRVSAQPFRLEGALDQSRDLDCLTQAVYYEARGETPSGQAAVAQVVLNRVRHPAFPKTVCGVVFQRAGAGCQFSFACNGATRSWRDDAAWRRSRTVAAAALGGSVMADVGNATHFQARSNAFGAGLLKVAQIGAHAFYRFGGRAGQPGMFRGDAQPSVDPATAPRTIIAGFAPLGFDPAAAKADAGRLLASASAAVGHVAESAARTLAPSKASPQGSIKLASAEPAADAPVPAPEPAAPPAPKPAVEPAKTDAPAF